MHGPILLNVVLQGDDHDDTEWKADHVSATIQGIGLAGRDQADTTLGYWPGGSDRLWRDENIVNLQSSWQSTDDAMKAGQTIKEWLLANMWGTALTEVTVTVACNGYEHTANLR